VVSIASVTTRVDVFGKMDMTWKPEAASTTFKAQKVFVAASNI